jgi:hypothetical protein
MISPIPFNTRLRSHLFFFLSAQAHSRHIHKSTNQTRGLMEISSTSRGKHATVLLCDESLGSTFSAQLCFASFPIFASEKLQESSGNPCKLQGEIMAPPRASMPCAHLMQHNLNDTFPHQTAQPFILFFCLRRHALIKYRKNALIKYRYIGTYDLEGGFSALVMMVGFKPAIRIALGVLRKVEALSRIRAMPFAASSFIVPRELGMIMSLSEVSGEGIL